MWIMLNKAFLSIVDKARDQKCLMVRARRAGEIEAVFPGFKGKADGGTDYAFRAEIPRELVASTIALEISRIDYGNFKGSVKDDARHDAYMGVWTVMMDYQLGRYDRKPARRAPSYRTPGWALPDIEDAPRDVQLEFRDVKARKAPAKRKTTAKV
jgi:hypothetical protein